MLQLSYRGNRHLLLEEVEPAPLNEGEVRVAVHSVGICKSDVYGYNGRNDRRDKLLRDGAAMIMGHEACGRVLELAADLDAPAVGTPVAVNPIYGCGRCELCRSGLENVCPARIVIGCLPDAPGAYAESMVVPAANVEPLAPGTPLEWGAMSEPLTVGAHGVRLAELSGRTSVLVIGGGIIGIGAALAARRTSGDVLVLEPLPERRELLGALGLESAHPDQVLGSSAGFDVAIDCVGRPETFAGAVRAVPPRGLVVLIGIWEDEIPLPVSVVVDRETRIMGSFGYSPADFKDVVAWIGRREVDLSPIIQNRVGFDGVIGAFEAYTDGSLNAVLTLVQPGA
jgi:threonine dehydrogenase-like Zn-dependent dehydrogenase